MATRIETEVFICDINNNIIDDISEFVEVVSVDWNDSRQIKMSASFTIRRDKNWNYQLDPYSNFLAPYMSLYYDDGTFVREQVGLFALDIPQKMADIGYTLDYFQGNDLTWLLAISAFTDTYNMKKNFRRDGYLQKLCRDVGIFRNNISPPGAIWNNDVSLFTGMYRLDAANYIAQSMAYYAVYATRTGEIASQRIVDLSALTAHATYTVEDIWTAPRKRTVATSIANVIVVTKDNPNGAPIRIVVSNDNADDPMSTVNRQTIARVFNNPDFTTSTDMTTFAKQMLKQGNSAYVSLDFTVAPDPTLNPRDVIDLVYNTGQDDFSGRYSIDAWTMNFSDRDAPLRLTVSRYEPLFTGV